MANEAHVRIDEGLKRGPRKKPPTKRPTIAKVERTYLDKGKLANLDIQSILERLIAGETSTRLAQELSVTRQGLTWWLRQHAEEDWKEAQIVQAIERKDRAQDELEASEDALSLARAREQLRGAQWELERVYSRIYGAKQEVTVRDEMKLEVVLDGEAIELLARIRPKGVVIDAHCVAVEADLPLIKDNTNTSI